MPLKHVTETFLLFLLGVVIATTGFVLVLMPRLPAGLLPWAILFILTVIYPIALSPLFIKRRADIPLRVLHWFPAFMVLLAIVFQLLSLYLPEASFLNTVYLWGWTLAAVVVGFVSLIVFAVSVLRRKTQRIALLLSILLPFAVVGIVSQTLFDWNKDLQALVWQGDWWKVLDTPGAGSGGIIAVNTGSGDSNLEPSVDPSEEGWRERLRAIEERRKRIAARMEERKNEQPVAASSSSSSSAVVAMGQTSSKPANLPHSGFEWPVIVGFLIAGYSAVLHGRAKKRSAL